VVVKVNSLTTASNLVAVLDTVLPAPLPASLFARPGIDDAASGRATRSVWLRR
jgi:hypothetical protein